MSRKIVLLACLVLAVLAVTGYFVGRTLLGFIRDRLDAANRPLPTIVVEANYPGANARVVADTVAAPIEQQINGVEGMLSMYSRSSSDGSYLLTITFPPDTDSDMAQVLIQNRVALALPILPDVLKRDGIVVRKESPALVGFVLLSAPEGRFDTLYLSNYARIQVKDELARVPGVAQVTLLGQRDFAMRIWLDPDKLTARALTALDVTKALTAQNIKVEAGRIAKEPGEGGAGIITLNTLGRLVDAEELAGIIVKADDQGQVVHLRDVAHVALGASAAEAWISFNGKPTVALAIDPLPHKKPGAVLEALKDRLAELRAHLPEGIDLSLAFDFASNLEAPGERGPPEYLRLDLTLPVNASLERTQAVANRCDMILRNTAGVQDVLTVSSRPFTAANEAFSLVRLASAAGRNDSRQQIIAKLRPQFAKEVPEAQVFLNDVTTALHFPLGGNGLELAIEDRAGLGADLRKLAEDLEKRLSVRPELANVRLSAGFRGQDQLFIEVDSEKAKALGLTRADVFGTLQAMLGQTLQVGDAELGRSWKVQLSGPDVRSSNLDLVRLQVRNAQGQMVPLSAVASVRMENAPVLVERYNMYPMVGLMADPAPGVSLDDARQVCETEFAAVFPAKKCTLTWLWPGSLRK
jgi:multidrug efflux pump subunit AcrB